MWKPGEEAGGAMGPLPMGAVAVEGVGIEGRLEGAVMEVTAEGVDPLGPPVELPLATTGSLVFSYNKPIQSNLSQHT